MIEIHDYPPIVDNEDNHMRVMSETAKGAQLIIIYEEKIGIRQPVTARRSITRHIKRIDTDLYEFRWFETYLDIENKVQVCEMLAIYKQDGMTAQRVSISQLRKNVSIKELRKVA